MNMMDYSYGVSEQYTVRDELDEKVLELKINGFTTIGSNLSTGQILELKKQLDISYEEQANEVGGHEKLASIKDASILRAALSYDSVFLEVATDRNLLLLTERYLGPEFVLVLQNGLINLPGHGNDQGKYHRDLSYQHWISSKPIAMNALLCLDEFTFDNGATWVVPGTHRFAEFPTYNFLEKFSQQITAPAGTFLILDAMLFHKAGTNSTMKERRAINHVIGLPFMGQVIDLPTAMADRDISSPTDAKLQRYLGNQWNALPSAKVWREKKFGLS